MIDVDEANESPAETLCKSCGLCCNGHLFIWTKLKSAEIVSAQAIGLNVFGPEPSQRGFSQPCPLWEGQCTIYTSPHYPHACRTYKCKLLKEVIDETVLLPHALTVIQQAKEMIKDVELLLPVSLKNNFRERLVERIEYLEESAEMGDEDLEFQLKARELSVFFEKKFGVKDLVNKPK